jgi:predicted nucleotide-binding protein
MSTQENKYSLDSIQRGLKLGNDILNKPVVKDKPLVQAFEIRTVHGYLVLNGSDSEIVKRFNSLADGALLIPDRKEGLKQLLDLASIIVEMLKSGVLAHTTQTKTTKARYGITKLFVGHGQNPAWSRVENHLEKDLGLKVEAFETIPRTAQHIVDILKGLLDECDAAVIVMTADDKTAEGTIRARQNVIHEAGLFQGRHGFNRVVLFQQEGTEDFSNIAGLQVVRFNQRVEEGFYELDRAIRKILGK